MIRHITLTIPTAIDCCSSLPPSNTLASHSPLVVREATSTNDIAKVLPTIVMISTTVNGSLGRPQCLAAVQISFVFLQQGEVLHKEDTISQHGTAKLLYVFLPQCQQDSTGDVVLHESLRHKLHPYWLQVIVHHISFCPICVGDS